MAPQKQKSLITRKKLYSSTLSLLNDKNINDITIQNICTTAGVSVGSFYKHFRTKTDIFVEMYDQADHYFFDKYQDYDESTSSIKAVSDYFITYAQYHLTIGLQTVKQLYTCNNKLFITKNREMQKALIRIIRNGQERKEIIHNQSAEDLTDFLFISARGFIYNWCLHDGNFDLTTGMEQYIGRLFYAIKM